MEYGLMLGFNKYIIPFQRASQTLPFNVAGLDTVKYENSNFERLAKYAIEQAISLTTQEDITSTSFDQLLDVFLLTKKVLVAQINTDGDKNIYQMGSPLGFNLLHDFSGLQYIYFGNFPNLRPEIVLWRLKMLKEILSSRIASLPVRKQTGMINEVQVKLASELISRMEIWLLVNSNDDKQKIVEALRESSSGFKYLVFSREDIRTDLDKL